MLFFLSLNLVILLIILLRALKLHPLSVDIWLKAAFWEYEQNHNVNAARGNYIII